VLGGRLVRWQDITKSVISTVLAAAILAGAAGIWKLLMEVHDLRQDVDNLYSAVDDVSKRIP